MGTENLLAFRCLRSCGEPLSYERSWSKLLEEAAQKPGIISDAYRVFHDYSTGNQLLALFQCYERGLQVGPINTYPGWQKLGRHVRKGEKAITLCMPVKRKRNQKASREPEDATTEGKHKRDPDDYFTIFVYKPNWFVLAQTEGEPFRLPELSQWDKYLALASLNITEIPFECPDGNTLGFARRREVAVSPLSPFPYKTLFHEVGHVELGHTAEADLYDGEHISRSLREAEAESVALLCGESLGLGGADLARGYIQHWLQGETIPEKSAQKILAAADRILKAGRLNVNQAEI